MRAAFSRAVVVVVLAAAAAATGGCTYDPRPLDGKLRCSTAGECPDGYSCNTCGTCWSDDRNGGTSGALWGNAAPSLTVNHYVGNWTFSSCADLVTQCDDGYTNSATINASPDSPEIMYITAGPTGAADLTSDWLCILKLQLSIGSARLYGGGQGCTLNNPDVAGLVQMWTATRFDIVTSDGLSAIHSAAYNRLDTYSDGKKTNCTQQVRAPMTKM